TSRRCACACGQCHSSRRMRRCSLLELQLGLADADNIAWNELTRPVDADAVYVRPVGRAEVVRPDAVAARLDAHMARGGELVAVDRDVVLSGAADRERRRLELELLALLERVAPQHHEPAGVDALADRAAGERRPEDEALLRQPQV